MEACDVSISCQDQSGESLLHLRPLRLGGSSEAGLLEGHDSLVKGTLPQHPQALASGEARRQDVEEALGHEKSAQCAHRPPQGQDVVELDGLGQVLLDAALWPIYRGKDGLTHHRRTSTRATGQDGEVVVQCHQQEHAGLFEVRGPSPIPSPVVGVVEKVQGLRKVTQGGAHHETAAPLRAIRPAQPQLVHAILLSPEARRIGLRFQAERLAAGDHHHRFRCYRRWLQLLQTSEQQHCPHMRVVVAALEAHLQFLAAMLRRRGGHSAAACMQKS
mmetsp:Transcript_115104/g.245952  ORF Transcript_115104/g.245952 Transcript_115104/m.245952 type:complete len:274 (+) Transcript_115104:1812-2633(+)